LSNNDTGKIAMPVESTSADGVESAMEKFGRCLQKIQNVTMDMSPTYALVFNDLVPRVVQTADKFHVMKYVYEDLGAVRKRIVGELQNGLSKGKHRSEEDRKLLIRIEELRRVSHAITLSPGKWNSEMEETIHQVFSNHEEMKTKYRTN
jgi:transposase